MEVDLLDLFRTRRMGYQFLSMGFLREPVPENFEKNLQSFFGALARESDSHDGLNLLTTFLAQICDYQKQDWDNMRREYQRLFYGPNDLPAPPWESVYRSKEQIILDEHTLQVREFYRKWGLEPQKLYREPDDHIGLELEFMCLLTQMTLDALSQGDKDQAKRCIEAQREFLKNHILIWVDTFCLRLSEGTEHPFYKALALFTPDYVHLDKDILDDILNAWDVPRPA